MARFDNLGVAIRTLRDERRWSQLRLARRAGVSAAMLSNYERGVRTPSLATLGKILDALDVSLGPLDHRLGRVPVEHHLPRVPDGVDVERFLGYPRLPADLVPAFSEMVAGFQAVARHIVSEVLSESQRPGR